MVSPATIIISILMFLTGPLVAQKCQALSIEWKLASELPVDSNSQLQRSLGFAGPVTGVHNDVLLVAGGANFPGAMPWNGGEKKFYHHVYVFTHEQDKIVALKQSYQLPEAIAYTACCSTPKGVLFAGGENEMGLSDKAWLMQWDAVAQNVIFQQLRSLPLAVSNAAAVVVGHRVFITGGETKSGASAQMISLDLNKITEGWKTLADVPHALSHTVSINAGNKIFLVGGRKKNSNGISDLYDAVFEYDITTNSWEAKASLPYALSAGTGAAINPDGIVLFGGDKGTTFHKVETLIAAINAEEDAIKKQDLIVKKNKLQADHPGFSKEVLLYNITTNKWKVTGSIPFDTPVTTTAVEWGSAIIIPSGEIKAGVRSPDILAAKILQKTK